MLIPELPNYHALAVMLLTAFALWLFRKDDLPLETSSLVILVVLALGFTLSPFEADGKSLEASDFFSDSSSILSLYPGSSSSGPILFFSYQSIIIIIYCLPNPKFKIYDCSRSSFNIFDKLFFLNHTFL